MYGEPPTTFDALVAPFDAPIRETALWLRTLLMTEFPQLEENVSGGAKIANALYSVGGAARVALALQPTARCVKLFIHDPEHLGSTPLRLEGSGKHMRHVKFTTVPAQHRDAILALARVPVSRRSKQER